jgi:hypothetical protein
MKYTVFCETEGVYKEIESLLLREVCPDNSEHIVTSGSLTVVDPSFDDCYSKDYRQLRHELMDYVSANYLDMTTDELKQAAYHFCVPTYVIDQFYTPLEQIANGKEFHKSATKCRKDRFEGCVTALFNHLTYEETGQIIGTLNDYIWQYVDLGVEGTTEGDPLGIFDYFTATSGTSFENAGFLDTGFTPRHGLSLIQLRDFILTILQSGCAPASQVYPTIS